MYKRILFIIKTPRFLYNNNNLNIDQANAKGIYLKYTLQVIILDQIVHFHMSYSFNNNVTTLFLSMNFHKFGTLEQVYITPVKATIWLFFKNSLITNILQAEKQLELILLQSLACYQDHHDGTTKFSTQEFRQTNSQLKQLLRAKRALE